MNIAKAKIETILEKMHATIDSENLIYKFYLLGEIEEGETNIRQRRVLSHQHVIEMISGVYNRRPLPEETHIDG